jgi:hypothetical protein
LSRTVPTSVRIAGAVAIAELDGSAAAARWVKAEVKDDADTMATKASAARRRGVGMT